MSATGEADPIDATSVDGRAALGPVESPTVPPAPFPVSRRAVAIASDAVELLRPASDLARLLTSFGRADVLLAAETGPGAADDDEDWHDEDRHDEDRDDWIGADRTGADRTGADRTGADRTGADRTGADGTGAADLTGAGRTGHDDGPDPLRVAVDELGHPDLVVHRLALVAPLRPDAEDDLVAAMSELVGFDPEPLVYCLAPAAAAGDVLSRAAERIAQVYGLPVLRYRCLELALVDPWDPEEEDGEPER